MCKLNTRKEVKLAKALLSAFNSPIAALENASMTMRNTKHRDNAKVWKGVVLYLIDKFRTDFTTDEVNTAMRTMGVKIGKVAHINEHYADYLSHDPRHRSGSNETYSPAADRADAIASAVRMAA